MTEFIPDFRELDRVNIQNIGELVLGYGLNESLADQLVDANQDVRSFMPGPQKQMVEQYLDLGSLMKWYTGASPLLLTLTASDDSLVANAWVSNARREVERTDNLSFVQTGESFRNQGIGLFLGRILHNTIDNSIIESTKFFIESNNQAGFEMGIKLGYTVEPSSPAVGFICMTRSSGNPNKNLGHYGLLIPKYETKRNRRLKNPSRALSSLVPRK